jgi:ribosome-binding protein aMBF1 (putative translation factor)
MKNYTWNDHKKELMRNPAFKKAYDDLELEYTIAAALIEARSKRGLTQKDLARKMKTTQSVISRVESAHTTPTLSFLKRLADVLNVQLRVSFQ